MEKEPKFLNPNGWGIVYGRKNLNGRPRNWRDWEPAVYIGILISEDVFLYRAKTGVGIHPIEGGERTNQFSIQGPGE